MSSLRHMIHAAAPCPPEVKRRMIEWWGPVIDEYYAASEGRRHDRLRRRVAEEAGHGRARPWPISEVVILDDDGNDAAAGRDRHRLHARCRPATSSTTRTRRRPTRTGTGKYFTVGDIGYLDEDGYLFLCDRKVDMIISGGVNIYPAEIESVLLTHPKVGDAAVFGIPHEDWGEEVKAVIEPARRRRARAPALADEILAFCADKLARYKMPKSIDFVAEMPRDPNGKLYKRKLRDPYWEGRERAI